MENANVHASRHARGHGGFQAALQLRLLEARAGRRQGTGRQSARHGPVRQGDEDFRAAVGKCARRLHQAGDETQRGGREGAACDAEEARADDAARSGSRAEEESKGSGGIRRIQSDQPARVHRVAGRGQARRDPRQAAQSGDRMDRRRQAATMLAGGAEARLRTTSSI